MRVKYTDLPSALPEKTQEKNCFTCSSSDTAAFLKTVPNEI
jgi:hypothetical protein